METKQLDMESLRKKAEQSYAQLEFRDDYLFCKILEKNPDIARDLVELILGISVKKVQVQKQLPIEITDDARGVRLDVYLEDDANTVYDLEMQTTKKSDVARRARYYQGMIDLNLIERGAKFMDLKESYVIFICMDDPFKAGRYVYSFENREVTDVTLQLDDQTHKVFLNANGTVGEVSDNLLDFFDLLRTGQGHTDLAKRIADEVQMARQHNEWKVEYMTLYMRDQENIDKGIAIGEERGIAIGEERGIAIGEEKTYIKVVSSLRSDGRTAEEIAKLLHISLEEVRKYMNQ